MTDDLVGRQTVHVRDDLDAYYFGFESTGNADVDRILGAIAYAGKAYHHTEDWDDASVIGVSCVGNIQNAAALAAARIEALEGEKSDMAWFSGQRRLSLDFYSPMYGDDDDQTEEWRVTQESGSINDREWDVIGRGDTVFAAVAAARAALTPEAPHAD